MLCRSSHLALTIVLAAIIPAISRAQDSTGAGPKEQTLLGKLGLKGAHIGIGGGVVPYLGMSEGGGTAELRLAFPLKRHPAWTVAFTANTVMTVDTTGYVAPSSNNFHPEMIVSAAGIELQRRWKELRIVHPFAVVSVGRLTSSYDYWQFPEGGGKVFHRDHRKVAPYASIGAGGELNIASWARATLTMGYRAAGATALPFARGSHSGLTSAMLFEFGKF